METSFAHWFYKSTEWKRCRAAFLRMHPICERCGMPARQVHHKTRITPENMLDPDITLNWGNLEALCEQCHQAEHKPEIRWRCDSYGHVEI